MDLDSETRDYALHFKPVAEHIVEEKLSDADFFKLVVSIGVERMTEDVIHPREPSVLWTTILSLLRRNPADFAAFMAEALATGAEDEERREAWRRYIG